MSLVNWAADKVQNMTGEKERRGLVEELQSSYNRFKEKVIYAVNSLNTAIETFNSSISNLNKLRKGPIESIINRLNLFLVKFGNCKPCATYVDESKMLHCDIPNRQLDDISNYISQVSWSKEDVFNLSFANGLLGTKKITHEQNLAMHEMINKFYLESEETLQELKEKHYTIEQSKAICDIYIECLEFIVSTIESKIIPELELIESFFEALAIKNELIAGNSLTQIAFHNDISILANTKYNKHFLLIKNSFSFYILSCKIYNSPVLTRLLNDSVLPSDITSLTKEKELLLEQGHLVTSNMIMER